ncbi:hypothetical protein SAMN05880590_106124 [Rhizobium sp. RU35A]|uniref:DUF4345 domain-containing protein n=1 Tax=Rhizobium straminoryzae TaxID=1387186 RepID=A0A549STT0_9HYPH|nr:MULTISPECIES: DUF4345 domain-containing protein [Rhizobium]TRL33019.1 DUF4345 domain-containing protein [Rhizobium straminoryzae]SIQ66911.1 hypothetical protein SAMN05880590_106124 [Rhizobium sp. RU35A]
MDFYFPAERPEQLAFLASALVALIGLFILALPQAALKLAGFSVGEVTASGYGATRATGGLYLGLGLTAVLVAQDWTYLALGASLLTAAFGRLVSILADRGFTLQNLALLLLQVALAALPLGYVLGYLSGL